MLWSECGLKLSLKRPSLGLLWYSNRKQINIDRQTPPSYHLQKVVGRDSTLASYSQRRVLQPPCPFLKTMKFEIAIPKVASICPGPAGKAIRSLGSPRPAGQFLPVHSSAYTILPCFLLSTPSSLHVQLHSCPRIPQPLDILFWKGDFRTWSEL